LNLLYFSGLMAHGKRRCKKLGSAEQHERRRQVVRAHKRGRTRSQIAEEVGLSYTTVSKVITRFEAQGMAALVPRKRGRRSDEDRALTPEQEARIQRLICDARPEQLKMDFALWSRPAVMQLIKRECGVTLHARSTGKYLAR
jgi:transposase